MSWLAFAFIGMMIWSAAAVADRALLLRIPSKKFYLLVPTLLQLVLCCALLPFMPPLTFGTSAFFFALASGVMEALVLYFLYMAVSREEVSRVFSLTGLGPVLTLVFGYLFLNETIAGAQLIAFLLFFAGGVILSYRSGKKLGSGALSKGLVPILIGSLITSVFFILLRQTFVAGDFWSGLFFSRIGFFGAGLVVLWMWRKEIKNEWSRLSGTLRFAVIGNQIVSFSGHYFYFLALSLASAALVQSVLSAQSGIIFLMAILVAGFDRRLLEEGITRRDLMQKAIGISLTAVAAYILAVF